MENQTVLKVVSTISERLDLLPFEYGQLILVKDTRQMYFDHITGRVLYNQMIILETEEQRLGMIRPVNGFYFVKETNIIWRYEQQWFPLTNPPSSQIEFLPKTAFPAIGDEKVLYIDGVKIYRWLETGYVEMGTPIWEPFS